MPHSTILPGLAAMALAAKGDGCMETLPPEWSIIVDNWDFVRSAPGQHIRELIRWDLENHPGHGVAAMEKQPE